MKLSDCTKEELIFVIERLQLYNLSDNYYIQRVLCDVEERRESRRLEEARCLSALFSQKWQEYIDILSPYDGKLLKDIPPEVLNRADTAMKEVQAADMKWRKLMGIHTSKPSAKKKEKSTWSE
ncbi:hypothetical protein AALC17_05255 [Oscillospiraceae bacterium 38-13]